MAAAKICFAQKGFAGTTIADIELAAGYTPRSGGLYRHFRSKEAMLEAVIDAELVENRRAVVEVPEPAPGVDRRVLLEQVVRRGLDRLDQQADLMRILFADLDQFPDLLRKVQTDLTDATYRDFAQRLAFANSVGAIPKLDFEAVAVLAIGPVVDFKIKQHLLGYTPLGLSEERLVNAWVDLFVQLFGGAK